MTTTTSRRLPQFEGEDVAKAAVRITNAGDGLSEALKVQPKALNMHDEVFYVLRGECTQVNHKVDKDELLTRLHTIKASQITEIDGATAQKMLTEAAADLDRRKKEIEGQEQLFAEQEAEERERADLASTGSARTTKTDEHGHNAVVAPFSKPGTSE